MQQKFPIYIRFLFSLNTNLITSTNSLTNYFFDTQWHLSERISSFTQGYTFFFWTQIEGIGQEKSRQNPTNSWRKHSLFFSNVYLRYIHWETLNSLHCIIYMQHSMCVFIYNNKWSRSVLLHVHVIKI